MWSPSRVQTALALATLLVLAGCAGPALRSTDTTTAGPTPTTTGTAPATDTGTTSDGEPTDTTDATTTAREIPDPAEDRLGWEDGYWYNESVSVTPEDGYNRSELDRLVARTMARIERIRQLEFTDAVSVEVITREEYRERNVFEFEPDPFRDQVYESLFLVGEDEGASEVLGEIYGGSVAGYYAAGDIVLVSDDPDAVELDRATLAHELVHALQDDQLQLSSYGRSLDGVMATRGLTEGEANYVMDRYGERCGSEWECIPQVQRGGGDRPYNVGVFLTLFVPYSDGPSLVGDLFEREGWAAVNRAYDRPPVSTEQLIHPEKYPDERPADVRVEDRSTRAWDRFDRRGSSAERVGEAAIFAMFWQNGIVDENHLYTDDARYNYSHPFAEGWGGDKVVPYRNGDEFGYVFKTVWDTREDADQFRSAYVDLLESKGATEVRPGVYEIAEDEPFGDAFRVIHNGKRVKIVNAPTVEDIERIHPQG